MSVTTRANWADNLRPRVRKLAERKGIVVRERPILIQGWGVRAISEGRKTVTRRVVKGEWDWLTDPGKFYATNWDERNMFCQPSVIHRGGREWGWFEDEYREEGSIPFLCPYGQVGDRLWVREKWVPAGGAAIAYAADVQHVTGRKRLKWKPSIFMPRWASRITLEVTGVRVERVQEITNEDIRREGVVGAGGDQLTRFVDFKILWDSINAKRGFGWDVNPWVWVIEFRRIQP